VVGLQFWVERQHFREGKVGICIWSRKDTVQFSEGKKMHVDWKGYNSVKERLENACRVERIQFSEGKVRKCMWRERKKCSEGKVRKCMWNGKDTIQRGKGKKMHVEWEGYNSARER
jgi:hypothetical protein